MCRQSAPTNGLFCLGYGNFCLIKLRTDRQSPNTLRLNFLDDQGDGWRVLTNLICDSLLEKERRWHNQRLTEKLQNVQFIIFHCRQLTKSAGSQKKRLCGPFLDLVVNTNLTHQFQMKSPLTFQWKAIPPSPVNSFIVKHLLEHVEENSKTCEVPIYRHLTCSYCHGHYFDVKL